MLHKWNHVVYNRGYWLLSLSIMSLRLIQAAVYMDVPFLSAGEWESMYRYLASTYQFVYPVTH